MPQFSVAVAVLEISPVFALLAGLLSTLHCLGMCGGIIGALSFSLPPAVRQHKARLARFIAAYNVGRLLSYSLGGALLGAVGQALLPEAGHTHQAGQAGGPSVQLLLSSLLMLGIGLYLGGWFPQFARLEQLGVPMWRYLEPLGRRFIPVRSLSNALWFGVIWGWLPCGLVYSSLLWAASAGSAAQGALLMFCFGLGTLPSMWSAGLFGGVLMNWVRRPYVRQGVGLSLVGMALINGFLGFLG